MRTYGRGRRVMDSDDAMTIMACIMLTLNFIRADPGIPYVPLALTRKNPAEPGVDSTSRPQRIGRCWRRYWTRSARIPTRTVGAWRNGVSILGAWPSSFPSRS